jgi:hypothetical protein
MERQIGKVDEVSAMEEDRSVETVPSLELSNFLELLARALAELWTESPRGA